jgi:hypothetical protein
MAGLFRLADFQSKVLLFQREAQILTAVREPVRQDGFCRAPAKTAEGVLFRRDTLAGVDGRRFDGDNTVQAYLRMVAIPFDR